MIYLASPYSHHDKLQMERRYLGVVSALRYLIAREKQAIYSPIAHWHPVAVLIDLPRDAEFWAEGNKEMMRLADKVIVLRLEGWDTSVGVKAEIAYANELEIPVVYL